MIPIPVASTATTTKVGTSVSALSPAIASRSSVAEPGPICVVLGRFFVIDRNMSGYIVAG